MASKELKILDEVIIQQIYLIRGQKVMLDKDLAKLYSVETKQLKRQVQRNIKRFPADFMFELTKQENEILRCQFATLGWGTYSKYLPIAFMEQGVAMLSSVLNSNTEATDLTTDRENWRHQFSASNKNYCATLTIGTNITLSFK